MDVEGRYGPFAYDFPYHPSADSATQRAVEVFIPAGEDVAFKVVRVQCLDFRQVVSTD